MIFPDGNLKEGFFENNVYKVKVQITNGQGQMMQSANPKLLHANSKPYSGNMQQRQAIS